MMGIIEQYRMNIPLFLPSKVSIHFQFGKVLGLKLCKDNNRDSQLFRLNIYLGGGQLHEIV